MPDRYGKRTFDEINEDGASSYGWLWIKVNEAAATVAHGYGMGTYSPQDKVKIMAIVFGTMNELNRQGVLKLKARTAKDFIMQSPTFTGRNLDAKSEI